nr:MAG TPA: hypothetical protein [Caudoviricetes sp.]
MMNTCDLKGVIADEYAKVHVLLKRAPLLHLII